VARKVAPNIEVYCTRVPRLLKRIRGYYDVLIATYDDEGGADLFGEGGWGVSFRGKEV